MAVKESNLFSFAISTKVIPKDNRDDTSFWNKMQGDAKVRIKTSWQRKSQVKCPQVSVK